MLKQLWPDCEVQKSYKFISCCLLLPHKPNYLCSTAVPDPRGLSATPSPSITSYEAQQVTACSKNCSLALCIPFFAIPKGLCPSWSICLVQHYFTYPNCHHHKHQAPGGINWEDLFVYLNFFNLKFTNSHRHEKEQPGSEAEQAPHL